MIINCQLFYSKGRIIADVNAGSHRESVPSTLVLSKEGDSEVVIAVGITSEEFFKELEEESRRAASASASDLLAVGIEKLDMSFYSESRYRVIDPFSVAGFDGHWAGVLVQYFVRKSYGQMRPTGTFWAGFLRRLVGLDRFRVKIGIEDYDRIPGSERMRFEREVLDFVLPWGAAAFSSPRPTATDTDILN